jgi:UDP-3-O-[3-hydroxymyristoyl] glucosamine N-acyltransferase
MQNKIFSLNDIARLTSSTVVGDPEFMVVNAADLESATSSDASFLANPRYEGAMETSKAGVVFVEPTTKLQENRNYLINENPSRAFQLLIELLYGDRKKITAFDGIHKTAVIHETAVLGKNVQIGPMAVIDGDVAIGDNTIVSAGCMIGFRCVIGSDCLLHPRVTIRERCVIGDRVTIQPGAVIGSCGFGYTTDKFGIHTKLNQIGNVIIDDDVEIGANTTVDRARFKSTKIGKGSKVDNLVQIAHGVVMGKHNIIVSQTGIAGSTELEDHVVIGGQVGITGHIKIAKGVMVAAKSGVTKSITKPGKYGGFTAIPLHQFNRNHVHALKLEGYVKEIRNLQARLGTLESR